MITTTIRLLVVAAATCGAALAQLAPERSPTDPEKLLLERIDALQREGGLNAEGLIEPLRALGLQYQEAGDHALAVVALEQARQVMRANRGLFTTSVDDALLLQQQIRSEKALGHAERVWNLQQNLMAIARQHFDDMRMLPVFLDLIDDREDRLADFRGTDFEDLPPGLYVPCEPPKPPSGRERGPQVVGSDARTCPFGSWATVVARLNAEIVRHYTEAIEVIVKNGDYASQELRNLERQVMRLVPFEGFDSCSVGTLDEFVRSELVGSCLEPLARGFPRGLNVGGRASLLRLVYYEFRSGAPAEARANAIAELADWYVVIEHATRSRFSPVDEVARAGYRLALAQLQQGGGAPEATARIFSPELPITLPAYRASRLASVKSSRYIDVGFAVTDYGKAEKIEVVARSAGASRGEERDLIRLIESASFRPRAVDGELAASAPVVVRYYLPEGSASDIVSAR